MPDKSKFEREIDKILEKTEKEPLPWTSKREDSHTLRRRSFEAFTPNVPKRKPTARGPSFKINAGHLVVVGLILLAFGTFVPVPQLGFVAAGIVLTLAGYALWFRKGSSGECGSGFAGGRMFGRGKISSSTPDIEPEVKYWRGHRIEEKPESRGDHGKIVDFGTAKDDEDSDKR